MTYKRVPRPAASRSGNRHGPSGPAPIHDYGAILSTAVKGDAVLVPLDGRTVTGLCSGLRRYVKARGLQFRSHEDKRNDGLIVWCVRSEVKP